MNKFIIFPRQQGQGVVLVAPCPGLDLDKVAHQAVPIGVPYKIVLESDLPGDKDFIDAWEEDFSSPDGYSIGIESWNIQNGVQQ